MRLATTIAGIIGSLSIMPALQVADDACSLLSQARVSEVLGVSVGPGSHQSETPNGHLISTWEPDHTSPKRLMIVLYDPIGGVMPADRFSDAKKPGTGKTITVSGIGDDAFFKTIGMLMDLLVKRGDSVIQMKLGGFPGAETLTKDPRAGCSLQALTVTANAAASPRAACVRRYPRIASPTSQRRRGGVLHLSLTTIYRAEMLNAAC
jgi:hypothetical protein